MKILATRRVTSLSPAIHPSAPRPRLTSQNQHDSPLFVRRGGYETMALGGRRRYPSNRIDRVHRHSPSAALMAATARSSALRVSTRSLARTGAPAAAPQPACSSAASTAPSTSLAVTRISDAALRNFFATPVQGRCWGGLGFRV